MTAAQDQPTAEQILRAHVQLSNAVDTLTDEIEPECYMEDNSIGPTEFWGVVKTHTRYDLACDDSGSIDIEWCEEDPPDLQDIERLDVWCSSDLADQRVEIHCELVKLSVSRAVVRCDKTNRCVEYWDVSASYDWRAA